MKLVRVKTLVSFNGMTIGDTAVVEDCPLIRGWERAGVMEVTDVGEGENRPGGPAPLDPGREHERVAGDRAPGAEPGEDPVPGGHGAPEGVVEGEAGTDLDTAPAVHD